MQVAMFMYNSLHGVYNKLFINLFKYNNQIHSYPTRASTDLYINSATSNIRRESLSISGPRLWNSISSH